MPAAGSLEKTPVLEILPYALDRNVLKSAIGVATLNAVSQIILESEDPKEASKKSWQPSTGRKDSRSLLNDFLATRL